MSSFTAPITVTADRPQGVSQWFIPPGWVRPSWRLQTGFSYLVGSEASPTDCSDVPEGLIFDGASVPILFRGILPMAHPAYLQAAALHDFMTGHPAYTDAYADAVFYEALGVLSLPAPWRWAMYLAVRLGSLLRAHTQKGRKNAD